MHFYVYPSQEEKLLKRLKLPLTRITINKKQKPTPYGSIPTDSTSDIVDKYNQKKIELDAYKNNDDKQASHELICLILYLTALLSNLAIHLFIFPLSLAVMISLLTSIALLFGVYIFSSAFIAKSKSEIETYRFDFDRSAFASFLLRYGNDLASLHNELVKYRPKPVIGTKGIPMIPLSPEWVRSVATDSRILDTLYKLQALTEYAHELSEKEIRKDYVGLRSQASFLLEETSFIDDPDIRDFKTLIIDFRNSLEVLCNSHEYMMPLLLASQSPNSYLKGWLAVYKCNVDRFTDLKPIL